MGIFSFRRPFDYTSKSPGPFTRLFTGSFDPVIAPLWATYFEDQGNVSYRSTNNSNVLDQFTRMITDADSGIGDYKPTLAIILTWKESSRPSSADAFPIIVPVRPEAICVLVLG